MSTIDRGSPIPLYYQLKQILVGKIEGSEWNAGDLIPSELELQETYNISRTTVRQTLSEMVFEGRLTRHRGRGTFVSDTKFVHDPNVPIGLSDTLRQSGIVPGWELLDAEMVEVPDRVCEILKLGDEKQAYRIRRIRLSNNDPIGIHTAFLRKEFVDLIDASKFEVGGSQDYLQNLAEMENVRIERTLEATGANEFEAELLDIEEGFPMLLIKRITMTDSGDPIEYMLAGCRGDRFKYQITI